MAEPTANLNLQQRLRDALNQRRSEKALRSLTHSGSRIDFCSNDYLGFARNPELHALIQQRLNELPTLGCGSTGSRLISGNSELYEQVESLVAAFHRAEAALIFNSGYDANLAIYANLPRRGDTVLYDQLAHASIRDGLRLGLARHHAFRHNDLEDLEAKLKQAKGLKFIAVESVYSMDGDLAPLDDMVRLAQQYQAYLIVDEAHGTGVIGAEGQGLVCALGLQDQVAVRLHTFGKALGCHGAAVVGSGLMRDFLINFARSLIYTTALPPHSLVAIEAAYHLLSSAKMARSNLKKVIDYFRHKSDNQHRFHFLPSTTPIQGLIYPGNHQVRGLAAELQRNGLDVRPILSPTVPQGSERLRVCLHAFNTFEQIDLLNYRLKSYAEENM